MHRYNGSSVLNYTSRINNNQSNLISSLWVNKIAVDNDNRIWFGTPLGLFVFDQKTDNCNPITLEPKEKVSPDNTFITTIVIQKKSVLVGTRDGLYEVDKTSLAVKNSVMTGGAAHFGKGTESHIMGIYPEVSDSVLWFTSKVGTHRVTSTNKIDTIFNGSKLCQILPLFLTWTLL